MQTYLLLHCPICAVRFYVAMIDSPMLAVQTHLYSAIENLALYILTFSICGAICEPYPFLRIDFLFSHEGETSFWL